MELHDSNLHCSSNCIIIFISRDLFSTSSTMPSPRHQIHLKLSLQQLLLIAPNYSLSSLWGNHTVLTLPREGAHVPILLTLDLAKLLAIGSGGQWHAPCSAEALRTIGWLKFTYKFTVCSHSCGSTTTDCVTLWYVFNEKNLCISGTARFESALFKQLYHNFHFQRSI